MYIVCKKGHLVYFWTGKRIFLPEESFICESRKSCMEYLIKCGHSQDRAIEIIQSMRSYPSSWISV